MVTGIGLRTPAGSTLAAAWETVLRGASCARPIRSFDPSGLGVRFACEVDAFDPGERMRPKQVRRTNRVAQLGIAAAVDALADAGSVKAAPERCGVVVGTGIGGIQTVEAQLGAPGADPGPHYIPQVMPNAVAALVAMRLGWRGPNLTVGTACAAGSHAIGEAVELIRSGRADVAVAGGAEAAITPTTVAGLDRIGALSRRNDDPAGASRPFDLDRDGFVLGEGATFLVLESLEGARARGASAYGEIAGYGSTCDAFHITAPSPGGGGAIRCMIAALEDAGLAPEAIGHVNAHGTSTRRNDAAEAAALAAVFGAGGVPVTAPKGAVGHLVGAAGAFEAVVTLLTVVHGVVPPVANCRCPDSDLKTDIVVGEPRQVGVRPGLSNSFAFGGHNASLVVVPLE